MHVTRDGIRLDRWWSNCNKITALMVAARYGNAKCVKLLKEKEATKQDDNGKTALMYAARYNQSECAAILAPLEQGK